MKSTCKREKCSQWDDGNCPMRLETTWVNEQSNQPEIIEDCAPVRSVLMLMDMHNKLEGYNQYACKTRNLLQELNNETREFMTIQTRQSEQVSRTLEKMETRQNKLIHLEEQRKKEQDAIPSIAKM